MREDVDALGDDLRQAVTRLYGRFRSERPDGEVGDAGLLVLMVLDKTDEQTLGDLAAIAHVTLASMSQTVQRLERMGLLTKRRDPTDGRRTRLSLTTTGTEAAASSRRHRQEWLNSRLEELSPEELADLGRAVTLLHRIAES